MPATTDTISKMMKFYHVGIRNGNHVVVYVKICHWLNSLKLWVGKRHGFYDMVNDILIIPDGEIDAPH